VTLAFTGIAVSTGIAIGEALTLRRDAIDVSPRALDKKEATAEVRRLKRALKAARTHLLSVRDNIPKDAPADISAFIETHILMLDDTLFVERPAQIIKSERINAEAALQRQKEELSRAFAADTIAMQHHGVAGFVTESGGPLSHTAILARGLGIPAIVGVHGARRYIKTGETLAIDGRSGMVLAEATDDTLTDFRSAQKRQRQETRELKKLIDTDSVTADGVSVSLMANIDIEEDLKSLKRVNADGVGLYRTEFLYLNRDTTPDEAEHALGLRGIRLCLSEPDELFVPQLRAILRASAKGTVRILLPMLTSVDEAQQCLALIEQVRIQLREEGIDFDESVPIGAMIEVPAAAVVADHLATSD